MSEEGLRERKKRETRRRIHSCAVDLVRTRGLVEVTIDEIAEAAGVSPRTFFNYFASKDAAVVGSDPGLVGVITASIAEQPADVPPLDCLENAFLLHALPATVGPGLKSKRWEVMEAHPHLIAAMLGAGRQLEQAAAAAIAARLGLPEDDPYPRLLTAAGYACVRVCLEQHRRTGVDPADAVRAGFAMLRAGLAAPAEGPQARR